MYTNTHARTQVDTLLDSDKLLEVHLHHSEEGLGAAEDYKMLHAWGGETSDRRVARQASEGEEGARRKDSASSR